MCEAGEKDEAGRGAGAGGAGEQILLLHYYITINIGYYTQVRGGTLWCRMKYVELCVLPVVA